MACQMSDAELEKTIAKINISTNNEELTAQGEVLKFEGFLKVYREDRDDDDITEDEKAEGMLPPLSVGQTLPLKEMLATVLRHRFGEEAVLATAGNFNNHIGVPLTLLSMPDDTEVAVIEMGTNQPGDIELLCEIARPTHGLLTNIGKEHLEGFGNLDGVKKAEGELYRYLTRHKGWIFVNLSEKYLPAMTRRIRRKIGYQRVDMLESLEDEKTICVMLTGEMPFVCAAFYPDGSASLIEVKTQLVGRHNFDNAMTAIALGIYFKVPAGKIKTALEAYVPSNNRSQLLHRGSNTIFLDAYNANPDSMRAALVTVAAMRREGGRLVAVLGDMLELGPAAPAEHETLGELAAGLGFEVVAVGQLADEIARGVRRRFGTVTRVSDVQEAVAVAEANLHPADVVVVKASRGLALDRVADALAAAGETA